MKYTLPKGVFDILPKESDSKDAWKESHRWNYVEQIIRKCAADYGYQEIRTPLFEHSELFIRSVGESTDIVSKEMYTFLDKGGRSLSLRPEGTVGTIRAFIEHQLYLKGCYKYFYIGSMFRYERPQKGRYREHHQFGIEALGQNHPAQDVEVIDMVYELYRRLGLKNIQVMLNTVGDETTRNNYKAALRNYLSSYESQLSEESQIRLQKNILRILDSKSEVDQKILENAPSILEFLSPEAASHFSQVQFLLQQQSIPFIINSKLVRGLDYYQKTVFEITSTGLGTQNSIGGGGRYDGLIYNLGGPDLPSIGFATGIERLLQVMQNENFVFPLQPHPTLFFIPLGEKAFNRCFNLLCYLRHQGFSVEMDLSNKTIQHGLQNASSKNAVYVAVIGDQELESGQFQLKNLASRQSQTLSIANIETYLKGLL